MISKDYGCSRYLITCRVVRTILEMLVIPSSVPKEGCVPTHTHTKKRNDRRLPKMKEIDFSPSSFTRCS